MRWRWLIPALALIGWFIMRKNNQIDMVARTIYGEARGAGREGMQAVANVIKNRVDAKSWMGKSFLDVVFKDYQFSAWNEGDPNRVKMLAVNDSDPAFAQAREIATAAILGDLEDITGGALHYHTTGVNPPWATSPGATVSARIGTHIFYTGVA